jgi:hypothetical protein
MIQDALMATMALCIAVMVIALLYAWYRLDALDKLHRDTCIAAVLVTLHHGKLQGNRMELTAPMEIPNCDVSFRTAIGDDEVRVWVELDPPELRRRKQEPAIQLDEDMAAALA